MTELVEVVADALAAHDYPSGHDDVERSDRLSQARAALDAIVVRAVDKPGTCHLVGCSSKGMRDHHVRQAGCADECTGTWPGGQPFHIQGCLNDKSRLPAPSPIKVQLDQADVVALLDYCTDDRVGPRRSVAEWRALTHRVSKALAVARNTQAGSVGERDA